MLAACQGRTERPPANTDNAEPSAQVSRAPAPPPEPAPAARPPAPPLPDPLPGHRRDLTAIVGKANRAALADLDGHVELVLVDAEALRVVDRAGKELARAPVTAGIQVLTAADHALITGWGESREHRGATAHVAVYRLDHGKLVEEPVIAPTTTRQDIVAAIADGPGLLLAYFDSKYGVTRVHATKTAAGWTTSDPLSIRMATSWAVGELDGHPAVVVGRLYGEAKGADGDAFVLAPDGTRKVVPTTRGVQSLAIAGGDLFIGDGWHQNYAQNAQGLLTWIHGGHAELIEDTPGQYTISQIIAADVDGDGKPEIITRGNSYVRVFKRTGDKWRGLTIAGTARDLAVGDLDGTGIGILVVGERSELVDLHGVTW